MARLSLVDLATATVARWHVRQLRWLRVRHRLDRPRSRQSHLEERRAEAAVTELEFIHDAPLAEEQEYESAAQITFRHENKKLGRNDLCHCQSGKKYKHCHGRLA